MYLSALAPSGRATMERALRQFAEIVTGGVVRDPRELDWSRIGFGETSQARAVWVQRYKPAGARVRLAAVRGALRTAWKLGQITADEYMRAVDFPAVRGESLPAGRALTDDEIAQLFEACAADGKGAGVRDAAIFAAFRTGCRVDELCSLDFHDYAPSIGDEPAMIRIRHAKGGRERTGYLAPIFDQFIRRWIGLRGEMSGPLFQSLDARGEYPIGKRMRRGMVHAMCRRRSHQAGIEPFSPHDLRRTVATQLHERGAQLADIRDVLGHRDLETTARYLRHDKDQVKRRAADLLAGKGGKT